MLTAMTHRLAICHLIAVSTIVTSCLSPHLGAQSVSPRIASQITDSSRTALEGSLHPLAQAQFDAGRLPGDTKLQGISIVFNRTAAQQADLEALIAAQQNPASPLYHQWLTPDQFAARFGMAQADLDTVQSWLQQQGFSIDSVARSKNLIRFSGTVSEVESAFATQLHYYKIGGVQHFAASTRLTVPSAIAPTILGVRNLDDFRPRSHAVVSTNARPKPAFTSSKTGNVYFGPGDIATAYNIKPIYSAGYNGTGQAIAIVGQSAVSLSDIENFQTAAGLTVKAPNIVLMPGTGSSTVYGDGDEGESDLDLEWSGAIAPGATIYFVYVGSNVNYSVSDALQYAIDEKIAPIISTSYGECEAELAGSTLGSGAQLEPTLESAFQQAATQGQTILAASGDTGSTDCFVGSGNGNPPLSEQQALAVDYPASSPYVIGVGGTEISSTADSGDYLKAGDGYWAAESGSDIISSALQYIPEIVWNEDSSQNGLSAGGGGASSLFTKPSWQTGVTGIPNDGKRDVPDLAVYASPDLPGYLVCTGDKTFWGTGQHASCSSGFRDSSSGLLTVIGGTSFGGPIYSGMLALINQQQNYSTGQGLVNPTLYTLAANSSTYAAAFHDITSGNNNCTAGSSYCSGTAGFSAGTGYDQVTGLGSVNAENLAVAWPATTGPVLIGTTTTITASNSSPLVNATDNFTITVTPDTGSVTPTGTVSLTIDNGTPITETLSANGTYVYTTAFTTAGTHTILASYAGNATFAGSTGTVSVNVAVTSSNTGTIALSSSPATLTVTQGNKGTETITVTPAGGYTGTVNLTVNVPIALENLCGGFVSSSSNGNGLVLISGTAPVTDQMILDTNASDCATPEAIQKSGLRPMSALRGGNAAKNKDANPVPVTLAFAGLLLAGFLTRSSRKFSRKFRGLAGLIALAALGLAMTACTSPIATIPNPPAGTYTITVSGQDSVTPSIASTTQYTFIIQAQ